MAETTVTLQEHPIMLTLRDAISGNGFLAGITLSGRALMRKEDDDKWWVYGVRPAGIAESGATVEESLSRFRKRYTETLIDIAQESNTFDEFKTEIERFFYEADKDDEQAWENALTEIRKGNAAPPEPFSAMRRESPESRPSSIGIERLDGEGKRFMPSDNVTDTYSVPQAA